MAFFKKTLSVVLSALILGLVVYFVPAPLDISLNSVPTLLLFFLPLIILIASLINLWLKNIFTSFLFSALISLIFLLLALKFYPALVIIIVFLALFLIYKKLKKPKRRRVSSKIKTEPLQPKIKKILG